jgi:hypothetical protein
MQNLACPDLPVRALEHSKRPAVADFYAVAGRFILFESQRGPLPGLYQLLSRLYLTPTEHLASITPDVTISFRFDPVLPPVPANFESFEISSGGKCYTDGGTYVFDLAGWRSVVPPPPSSQVEVWVGSEPNLDEAEQAQLLFYAISTALRRCGLYELHSGAVIGPDDAGVLLVGPSGSGKSTLTLQLAASGWPYLTDDVLLLSERARVVDAQPFRRSFAVTKSTIAASGHLQLQEAMLEHDWRNASKRHFTPHDFFPNSFVSSCQPCAIFLPVITGENGSRVRTLSRSEAMIRLVKMCPWSCYDRLTAEGHQRVLASLTRQCLTFELLAGRDVINDPAHVSRLISAEIGRPRGKDFV